MKLYYHADRASALQPGDVIKPEPYYSETYLNIWAPFMDQVFLKRIEKLCRDGLSLHGAHYLIQAIRGSAHVSSLMTEIYFEYIRQIYFKDRLSRFQSVFAFDDYSQALEFSGGQGKIFEVDFSGSCFVADMKWLKPDFKPELLKHNAQQYWGGKPFDGSPKWECLLELPVTVLREMVLL